MSDPVDQTPWLIRRFVMGSAAHQPFNLLVLMPVDGQALFNREHLARLLKLEGYQTCLSVYASPEMVVFKLDGMGDEGFAETLTVAAKAELGWRGRAVEIIDSPPEDVLPAPLPIERPAIPLSDHQSPYVFYDLRFVGRLLRAVTVPELEDYVDFGGGPARRNILVGASATSFTIKSYMRTHEDGFIEPLVPDLTETLWRVVAAVTRRVRYARDEYGQRLLPVPYFLPVVNH